MSEENQKQAKLKYKLVTGIDDSDFCKRISALLNNGYNLYGSPSITFNGKNNIVAQAVILKDENLEK
jgi:hypothetical protein